MGRNHLWHSCKSVACFLYSFDFCCRNSLPLNPCKSCSVLDAGKIKILNMKSPSKQTKGRSGGSPRRGKLRQSVHHTYNVAHSETCIFYVLAKGVDSWKQNINRINDIIQKNTSPTGFVLYTTEKAPPARSWSCSDGPTALPYRRPFSLHLSIIPNHLLSNNIPLLSFIFRGWSYISLSRDPKRTLFHPIPTEHLGLKNVSSYLGDSNGQGTIWEMLSHFPGHALRSEACSSLSVLWP